MRNVDLLTIAAAATGIALVIAQPASSEESAAAQSRVDKQLFCHEGHIFNSDGLKVSPGKRVLPNCEGRVSGSLFCHEGHVFNSAGKKISPGDRVIPACEQRIGVRPSNSQ